MLVIFLALLLASGRGVSARWNILVYGLLDNNLECLQLDQYRVLLNSLKDITKDVAPNIYVFADRNGANGDCDDTDNSDVLHAHWTTGKDMIFGAGGTIEVINTYADEPDSSDRFFLAEFIERAIKTLNDKEEDSRWMIVFGDHGGAFAGLGSDYHTEGDKRGHDGMMPVPDILYGLSTGMKAAGLPIFDIISFDNCLMSNLHVQGLFTRYAKLVISSEMTEAGTGQEWSKMASSLSKKKDGSLPDALPFAIEMVDLYVATPSCTQQECTLSVTDMVKLKSELQPAMLVLANALLADVRNSKAKLKDAFMNSVVYSVSFIDNQESDAADLYAILEAIKTPSNGFSRGAQAAALKAIVAFKKTVAHSAMGEISYGMNGLSVFCPQDEAIFLGTPSMESMKSWDLQTQPDTIAWVNMWSMLYTGKSFVISKSGVTRSTGVDVYTKEVPAANIWDAAIEFTRQSYPGDKGVPSYVMKTQITAKDIEAVTSFKFRYGIVDESARTEDGSQSYILTGSGTYNNIFNVTKGADSIPVVGTWNAKFYALKQSINVNGDKYEALSLLPVVSVKTNVNPKTRQPVSTTVVANVTFARGTCSTPGSMYQTANLVITTQLATGETAFKLMIAGRQGVFGSVAAESQVSEAMSFLGGVIITSMQSLTLRSDGKGSEKITFAYADCFKWGYPSSLSLISEMTIRESMANVNQDLLDINRQLTIVMSLSDENGNDRYFKPVGVYTPVAGGPDPSVVPKITARKCTCVNGWTSSKGTIHRNTCSPNFNPNLGRDVSTCPVVPGTCGGRIWDACDASEAMDRESPTTAGSCTAETIEPACGDLYTLTGNQQKLLDFQINYPEGSDNCPPSLRDPRAACFTALNQMLKSGFGNCSDANFAAHLVNSLIQVASRQCEERYYGLPAKLFIHNSVGNGKTINLECPSDASYKNLSVYAPKHGSIVLGMNRGPSNMSTYAPNSDCVWYIITPPDRPILTLFSSSFDTESNYDTVEVSNGEHVMATRSGKSFGPPLISSTGVMIVRFRSDSSIGGRGFVINYTSYTSTEPPPTCGSNNTALLTAVIETRSSASDVSWALVKGPVLSTKNSRVARRSLRGDTDFTDQDVKAARAQVDLLFSGGSKPRLDSLAGAVLFPLFRALPYDYAQHARYLSYACAPAGPSVFYAFTPGNNGWLDSTLSLYTSTAVELLSGVTIAQNESAKVYEINIPPLNKLVFQGQDDISYKPPIAGRTFNLTLFIQVSPNIFGTTAPPLLVMHAVREAISITLNDPLSYITSSNGVTSEDSVTSVFFIKGTGADEEFLRSSVISGALFNLINKRWKSGNDPLLTTLFIPE